MIQQNLSYDLCESYFNGDVFYLTYRYTKPSK